MSQNICSLWCPLCGPGTKAPPTYPCLIGSVERAYRLTGQLISSSLTGLTASSATPWVPYRGPPGISHPFTYLGVACSSTRYSLLMPSSYSYSTSTRLCSSRIWSSGSLQWCSSKTYVTPALGSTTSASSRNTRPGFYKERLSCKSSSCSPCLYFICHQ